MSIKASTPSIDLSLLTMPSAFQLAVRMSGKPHHAIADAMGWSDSVASRLFNVGDDYWPSLASVPALCRVLGNTVLAEWIVAASGGLPGVAHPVGQPLGVLGTMQRVEAVAREVGDVLREAGAAMTDGKVDPVEARRVWREATHAVTELMQLIAGMQAVVDAGTEHGCSE